MKHLNGNLPCVISCDYTSFHPTEGEVYQFVAFPLHPESLKPHPDINLFSVIIRPQKPVDLETVAQDKRFYYTWLKEKVQVNKEKAFEAFMSGTDTYTAADLFDRWFDALQLGELKQLIPIAHNWAFDTPFLINWLGSRNFKRIFFPYARDTAVSASFLNDCVGYRGAVFTFPYQKVDYKYLYSTQKNDMDLGKGNDSLNRAWMLATIYRKMVDNVKRSLAS